MTLGRDLQNTVQKKNSARAWPAKVDIRQRVLEYVGAGKASVFDAFAGTGELHRAVWAKAAHYEGCDRKLYLGGRDARPGCHRSQ